MSLVQSIGAVAVLYPPLALVLRAIVRRSGIDV